MKPGKTRTRRAIPSEIGNRKVDGGPNFYSLERELALGRQLSLEVERQAKLFEDPIVNEYLNRLVQNLARHSDVTFPVSIKIIESDQPNAFTLPGGHMFIDTGLIRLTESEAELAATLAHELARCGPPCHPPGDGRQDCQHRDDPTFRFGRPGWP